MERWAEFVLRHRKWVVIFWVAMMIGGGAVSQTVTDRLTIDFKLPGEPGTKAADAIVKEFHNGGDTSPALVSITLKQGASLDDPGTSAAVADAFDKITTDVPSTRVVDEANSGGDKAFRTKDGRTAYAYVFYPFPRSQSDLAPTDKLRASLQKSKPDG